MKISELNNQLKLEQKLNLKKAEGSVKKKQKFKNQKASNMAALME